ncbi:MAG: hypothetical protein QOE37_1036 [Microbacteriaceae bacterium]|nr:hypothetical protein [Microbacteriaceae bacterium]
MNWVVILVQLPSEPSRHRVAVWRELRKGGAVPVGAGTWALPASPVFQPALDRASTLCRRGGGTLAVLDTQPRDDASERVLREAFTAARLDEWTEFSADCGKFEAQLADVVASAKFTLGELEEQEQSLDRLRRWFRDLRKRDVLQLPEAKAAGRRLRGCEALLNEYADRVYEAVRNSHAWTGRGVRKAGQQDVVA